MVILFVTLLDVDNSIVSHSDIFLSSETVISVGKLVDYPQPDILIQHRLHCYIHFWQIWTDDLAHFVVNIV